MNEQEIIDLAIADCIKCNGANDWSVMYTGHKLAEVVAWVRGYYAALNIPIDFHMVSGSFGYIDGTLRQVEIYL